MKAVVYHADAHFAWGGKPGNLYKMLFGKFMEMCHKHGIQVVHLTLQGHPGWGDENRHAEGLDPANVVLNRELCFTDYLETAPEGVYWFAEPDYRISNMWPALEADMAICYRPKDNVPMCPAWRMATPAALPVFRKLRDTLLSLKPSPGIGFDWHGDSWAFTKIWHEMGCPKDRANYLGVEIEFRNYEDYLKPKNTYGRNYFGKSKLHIT